MPNFSWFFTDTTDPGPQVGDGRPYTAAEWRLIYSLLWAQGDADRGVASGVWNECEVTVTGANSLQVDTGLVLVAGGGRVLEAAETLAPASAGAGTSRKDSVVAQLDLTGAGEGQYEVQVYAKAGTAGAYPALTQNANVWEIRLYNYIIDDAGAITGLSDQRQYLRAATGFDHGELEGLADDDHAQYYNAARHTKAVHDALLIDAGTLEGYHAADFLAAGSIYFLGMTVLWGGAIGGSDGHRPIVGGAAMETWHWANGDLVNTVQTLDSRGKFLLMSDGAAGTYPVNASGGAAAINILHAHGNGTLAAASHAHGLNSHTHGPGSYTTNNAGSHFHNLGTPDAYTGTNTTFHTHTLSGTTQGAVGYLDVTAGGVQSVSPAHVHGVATVTVSSVNDNHMHYVFGKTQTALAHTHSVDGGNSGAAAGNTANATAALGGAMDSALSATQAILPPFRSFYAITYIGT